MTEVDYSDSDLWSDLKYFEEESSKEEYMALHEAGHLVFLEALTKERAMYGWMMVEGMRCPCVVFPKTPLHSVGNIMVSMAGDIASMVYLDMDVLETSLALYRYYHPAKGCDWDTVRELCPSEESLMDYAKDIGGIMKMYWLNILKEYRMADIFFHMWERIPQVVELIDKDDRPALEKFFGKRRGYGQVRKRLLDPNTAWEFCKHPNRDS